MYNTKDRIKCIKAPKPYFTVGKAYSIVKIEGYTCWVMCDDGEYRSFSVKDREIFSKYFKDVLDWNIGDKVICYEGTSSSFSPSLKEKHEYTVTAISDQHIMIGYTGGWFDKRRFRNIRMERSMKLKKLFRDNG